MDITMKDCLQRQNVGAPSAMAILLNFHRHNNVHREKSHSVLFLPEADGCICIPWPDDELKGVLQGSENQTLSLTSHKGKRPDGPKDF